MATKRFDWGTFIFSTILFIVFYPWIVMVLDGLWWVTLEQHFLNIYEEIKVVRLWLFICWPLCWVVAGFLFTLLFG